MTKAELQQAYEKALRKFERVEKDRDEWQRLQRGGAEKRHEVEQTNLDLRQQKEALTEDNETLRNKCDLLLEVENDELLEVKKQLDLAEAHLKTLTTISVNQALALAKGT